MGIVILIRNFILENLKELIINIMKGDFFMVENMWEK